MGAKRYFGFDPADITVESQSFEDWIFVDDDSHAHYAKAVELYVIFTNGSFARPHAFVDFCTKEILDAFDRTGLFTVGTTDPMYTGTESTEGYEFSDSTDGYEFSDSTGTPGASDSTDAPGSEGTDAPGSEGTDAPGTEGTDAPDSGETDAPDSGEDGSQTTDTPPSENNCDVKDKAGNPKRPIDIGSDGFCLNPMRRSSDRVKCFLENRYVKVVDLKNRNDDTKTKVATFTCSEGYDDERNGGYSPIMDAFFFTTKSALMYRDWYDYAPLSKPIPYAKVHYRRNYNNAYWDGQSLVFGDGDGDETYPLTGLDTVAHELGHGVTEKASNLAYRRESGGMNEAFSDIVGEAAELFVFEESDWVSGAEMFIAENTALRYFDDPTKDGNSIKHVKDYFNGMDVHYSSGIYNHVFYLMAKDLGIRAAFECFLTANRLYWREESTFERGACGTLRGAYDGGYDMESVAEAFRAVGITMSECPNLVDLVTAQLNSGQTQTGLRVSGLRHPTFKIRVPSGKSRVTVNGSDGLEIAVGTSHRRDSTPLASGSGSVSVDASGGTVVYARFYRGIMASEVTDGTASVSFS